MTKKSHAVTKAPARLLKRRMTALERNVATTTTLTSLNDPDDTTLGFGPRSLDHDRRTERLSYRDPEESWQGPLRLDETNYSVERLTLPEGGYNEYADEYSSYRDEEGMPGSHGPDFAGVWQNPQYMDSKASELLDELPPSNPSPAYEPDDPDLGFRLTAEDLETSPDRGDYFNDAPEKSPGFGHHAPSHDQHADELIREEVYQALDCRADIDAPNISLHVRRGVVTIEGEVSDAIVRHRIEECVDGVDGVKDINNRLHLSAPQSRKPWSDE
ncbi:BON domain-containing protein [Dyella monticola]|uniref:BON domain-containing protein n=1 Tax=Dyella monticola TaxID=1927958 RepID=A0A370WTQ6_9GAMM|nr:BON domain-containing protein [Dyella monticola]RDS79514.1 BON domain-containing protein [Dyella monticola]